MKTQKLLCSLFAFFLLFMAYGINAQDNKTIDIRSQDTKHMYPPSYDIIYTTGDSCLGAGHEQHDGNTHANGYGILSDSAKIVQKMRPAAYPWQYTKICVGFTSVSGAPASFNYNIIMYDSTGTGPGTNLLYFSPTQTITTPPAYPLYQWYSSTVTLPVITSGAVYIGVQYDDNPNILVYVAADENAGTTLWPGYYSTALAPPPVWTTLQTAFASYKALGLRAEGHVLSTGPNQPHQWCSNFPAVPGSGPLWGHATATYGDTIYVAGGAVDINGNATNTLYKYSIGGNNWTTGATLPGPKISGSLVACNGKLYYIGGSNVSVAGTPDAAQYVYNPATGQWSTIANIPTPTSGNVAVQVGDANIYCLMGGWSTYTTTIQVYNIAGNSWSTATAFSGGPGRRSFAAGILGRTIFVACGYNGTYLNSTVKGVVDPSNPALITWTPITNILWTASRAGGIAIAGRFYVCPGDTGTGTATNRIGIYDTTAGTWSYVAGDPFIASNYWGSMAAQMTICNGVQGVKVFKAAGLLTGSETTRPLVAFADTCLNNCGIVGITGHNVEIPNTYTLFQNYPNPFNPTTDIKFSIPKSGVVKIVVFDILGREVRTLVNEFRQTGEYNISFDASNLASGVYFYRLEANDFTQTKKMLLIK